MKQKTFRTRRLLLRPFTVRDFAAWHAACANRPPKEGKYDRGPLPQKKATFAAYLARLRRWERLAREDKTYVWGAFERASGRLAATVDISPMLRSHYQFGNLGYMVHPPFRGQGFAKEATAAALRIAFRDLRLNRLEAAIRPDNRVSIAVAKAIGMKRESLRRAYQYEAKERIWADHVVLIAIPSDVGLKPRRPWNPR